MKNITEFNGSVIIPWKVLNDFTKSELKVYAYLYTMWYSQDKLGNEFVSYSIKDLMKVCNIGRHDIITDATRKMKDLGLIEVVKEYDSYNKKFSPNKYKFMMSAQNAHQGTHENAHQGRHENAHAIYINNSINNNNIKENKEKGINNNDECPVIEQSIPHSNTFSLDEKQEIPDSIDKSFLAILIDTYNTNNVADMYVLKKRVKKGYYNDKYPKAQETVEWFTETINN